MWLVGVSLVVVAFAAVSLWLSHKRRLNLKSWLASAALVAWVVGVGVKLHLDRTKSAPSSAIAALPSIAWPTPTGEQAALAVTGGATEVAPVASLIGGLEQRLAAQPDDANGWALLAQSYSFMGDFAAAEKAVAKAVALGIDEQALRAKVDGAKRDPHPARTGG